MADADVSSAIQYVTFNTSASTSNTLATTGVYYPNTTYVPQVNWEPQPAYVYGSSGRPDVVALPVDTSDDPIAWLKGRVQEMQDCWKEAA